MTILDQLLSAAKESAEFHLHFSGIGSEEYEVGIRLKIAIAACEIKEPQAESNDQTQKEQI